MASLKQETITIPAELAEKLKRRAKGTGFNSLSSYVVYILRQVLSNIEEDSKKESFTKEGEKEVKAKLRKLGYL